MDSREPLNHHPHQRPPPPQLQPQPQRPMMMGPTSFNPLLPNPNNTNNNNSPSHLMNPNSTGVPSLMSPARFPFNAVVSPQPQPQPQPPPAGNNVGGFDAAIRPCGGGGGGFGVDSGKKKRGRPRKYSPEGGNIALGLSPTTPVNANNASGGGGGDSGGTPSSEPGSKKHRGRPPGSGKKQLDALGTGGVGFTPHVITVNPGEDIAGKVVAFTQQGPRTVCILTANGAVSNVTLRHSALSGGTVQYEGRYEIISLAGSFLPFEDNGGNRTGGFSVSLAGSDGKVIGGGVAGLLTAASPTQVIVGSFIVDGKKSGSNTQKSAPSTGPASQMLNFGAPTTSTSPTSQGPSTDESSEEQHENNGDFNRGPGLYNNNNNNQALHNMQMYQPQLWAGQTHQ